MASCSPQKRLNRFLDRHPEFKTDTLIHDTIIIEEMVHDTTIQALPGDTVIIEKENIQVQIIRVGTDSIDVRIERHEVKIPVLYKVPQIKNNIPATASEKRNSFNTGFAVGFIIALALVYFIALIIARISRKKGN